MELTTIFVFVQKYLLAFFITVGIVELVKRMLPDRASFRWEVPTLTVVVAILCAWLQDGAFTRDTAQAGLIIGIIASGTYRAFFATVRGLIKARESVTAGKKDGAE